MKYSVFAGLLSLIFILTSAPAWSVELANPPPTSAHLYSHSSMISTMLSNWKGLSESAYVDKEVSFALKDGTVLGGLLFLKKDSNPAPLIIVNFGALADRWYNTTREFIQNVFLAGKINANILVVDNVTSSGFFALNSSLSLGGYDEGRILVELAQEIQRNPVVSFTSMHIMGVSLGGLAAMHALIEDQRLGTHLFQSAICFSGVVDEESDTQLVLSTFGYDMQGATGKKMGMEGRLLLYSGVEHFDSILSEHDIVDFHLGFSGIGKTLYQAFDKRLHAIASSPIARAGWNDEVDLQSVEKYVHSSSILTNRIGELHVPLILVHAKDDPVVPYSEFKKFADEQSSNPYIQTLGTNNGGHWGFEATYGTDWIVSLLNRMLTSH